MLYDIHECLLTREVFKVLFPKMIGSVNRAFFNNYFSCNNDIYVKFVIGFNNGVKKVIILYKEPGRICYRFICLRKLETHRELIEKLPNKQVKIDTNEILGMCMGKCSLFLKKQLESFESL